MSSLKKRLSDIAAIHVEAHGQCWECSVTYPCRTAELALVKTGNAVNHNGDRDGGTFEAVFDADRLNKQSRVVYEATKDGVWRTLKQVSEITGAPEASVSARLRDFRKERFGGITVERRRVENGNGLHEYRVVVEESVDAEQAVPA